MNEIIGIIPHKFRRRGFGVACTLLLRAGLNFLGLAVLLPVLALALDARSLDGGGQLARIYTALGFTSPRSFALTVCAAVVAVAVSGVAKPPPLAVTVFRISPSTPGGANSVTRA